MRALSTCLSVILGMSVCYLAACSSDSDASGGAGGGSSMAGSSGKAGSSGSPGAAGAPGDCAFESDACTSCLTDKCQSEVAACAGATDCRAALDKLDGCACGGEMTAAMCETAFIGSGGDAAQPLVDCFNQNCASVCAM
jgi:hypothetical protein